MSRSVEMLCRVLVGGIVAAADVTAAAADPQMQPLTAALQAFLATKRARRDAADAGDVAAAVCHDRSHLAGIEQKHIGASRGKGLHVRRGGPALGAAKGSLYRRETVEGQDRDQMQARRSRGCRDGARADRLLSQTRDFPGNRNVLLEIVLVESSGIFWRLVHHHEFGDRVSP